MIKIGVTGGSGCGKTTILRWLAARGAFIIDCDEVYHILLDNNKDMNTEIKQRFPSTYVNDKLDRKKLGAIVFNDKTSLLDLNFITHKYVDDAVKALIDDNQKRSPSDIIVIDAFGLIESGISKSCDYTIGVVAPTNARLERIMRRDGVSEEYAKARIAAQKHADFYFINCDYVLENDKGYLEFYEKCEELLKKIIKGG